MCVFVCVELYPTWCFLSFLGCVARSFPWILEVINCYLFTCLLHHSILSFLNFNYMNAARLDICPQLLDALLWFNILGIFFSSFFFLLFLFYKSYLFWCIKFTDFSLVVSSILMDLQNTFSFMLLCSWFVTFHLILPSRFHSLLIAIWSYMSYSFSSRDFIVLVHLNSFSDNSNMSLFFFSFWFGLLFSAINFILESWDCFTR